jgi:hypothetical protein
METGSRSQTFTPFESESCRSKKQIAQQVPDIAQLLPASALPDCAFPSLYGNLHHIQYHTAVVSLPLASESLPPAFTLQ